MFEWMRRKARERAMEEVRLDKRLNNISTEIFETTTETDELKEAVEELRTEADRTRKLRRRVKVLEEGYATMEEAVHKLILEVTALKAAVGMPDGKDNEMGFKPGGAK